MRIDDLLYFTMEEKLTFLAKKGYEKIEIATWENVSVYHNDVEVVHGKMIGVIKIGEKPNLDDQLEMHAAEAHSTHSIDRVFGQEIRKAWLTL